MDDILADDTSSQLALNECLRVLAVHTSVTLVGAFIITIAAVRICCIAIRLDNITRWAAETGFSSGELWINAWLVPGY